MIASTLSAVSAPVPTAAAERNRPSSSLAAFGKSSDFLMSFKVMRPLSSKPPLTTRIFSIRWRWSNSFTSSSSKSSPTVTNLSFDVMMVSTVASRFASNLTSRLVTMPTRPELSTTGIPEISFSFISATRSRMVASTGMVKGSLTTPLSYFFTRRTSRACFSMLMLL